MYFVGLQVINTENNFILIIDRHESPFYFESLKIQSSLCYKSIVFTYSVCHMLQFIFYLLLHHHVTGYA